MSTPSPIAIVGMACRLSGGVATPEDLWTMISRSRDGWCPIPEDRFSTDAYYHPNPQKKGCFNMKSGYFMNRDLSEFDAPFFNITEQEAIAMDPQQRQLLECTYEALESAGIPKEAVSGSSMGVFVGASASSYRMGTLRDLNQVPLFDSTGNHQSIQAARISHFFNLRGPCFSLDTACSSSLFALHAAVQSLRAGETDSAIVAGCSLHLQPNDFVSMSMMGIFNNYGKTFSFDHRAKSGFARGEGVGCLVLKPLEQAIKDHDRVRCIITNTGVNQDGKTVGISLPNGDAQEELIREVYARANISPKDTGYVEAHGTGTKVGDPLEAAAIHRVFGDGRTKRSPLYIGSVKSNVGHLENASGIISIIKAALMLEKGFILPNLNFQKANEAIPLDEWNMKVPINLRPWPKDKRYISVNNFGFGGSNAHAVLEKMPPSLSSLPAIPQEQPKLFIVCASDEAAAKRMMSQLNVYLEQHPEIFEKRIFNDIAYTMSERRSHLPWRVAVTSSSCDQLCMSLNNPANAPRRSAAQNPKIGFIYTGQGAQWAQMGRELLDIYPVFAETMQQASSCLERLGASFSLVDELVKPKEQSKIGQAYLSQPICTAVQLGVTDLLASWGVKPGMVLGHSSGEIVAAYAAGAIDIDSAMSAAYYRGQMAILAKTRHPDLCGAMMAVGCDAADIQRQIKLSGFHKLTAACHNSPNSTTVSGDEDEIDQLAAELEEQGTFNRKLRVDVAYHSPHMALMADDYLNAIRHVVPQPCRPEVAFYSSLIGKRNTTEELGASYWVNNLVKPVLFSAALQDMYKREKPDVLVEIGPHSALEGPIKQILRSISPQAAADVKYFPTLVRNSDSATALVDLAGKLFVRGQSLRFDEINQTSAMQKPNIITDFPPYPWTAKKYWFESRSSAQHRSKPFARHDLLGLLDENYTDSELSWRNVLSLDDLPWLKDHRMQSLVTFPLAGYVCMAVEAASQRAQLRQIQPAQIGSFQLREIHAFKALIMDTATQYETVVALRPYAEGTRAVSNVWDEFSISSWAPSRGWLEHCRGLVSVKKIQVNDVHQSRFQAAQARQKDARNHHSIEVPLDVMYAELAEHGAEYGPLFRNEARDVVVRGDYTVGTITVLDTAASMHSSYETPSIVPAPFMDLMLQFTFPLLGAGFGDMPSLFMPSAINDIEISTKLPSLPGKSVQTLARGRIDHASPGPVSFSIDAWDASSTEPVITMEGLKMSPVNGSDSEEQRPRSLCYKVAWELLLKTGGKAELNGEYTSVNGPGPAATNGHIHISESPSTNGDSHANGFNGHHDIMSSGATSYDGSDVHGSNGGADAESQLAGCEVVLVSSRSESDSLVASVLDKIQRNTGLKPVLSSFAELKVTSSKHFICLDELDTKLLAAMTESVFTGLQSLLLNASSVLWVSSGAYSSAASPERNVAQGIFRTVRSETGKALATLDLDPQSSLEPSAQADIILASLESFLNPPGKDVPADFEFYERNGQLAVPRVVPDDDLNGDVFHRTQPRVPFDQDFQQPGRQLKMVVGTAGALDSLYWKDEAVQPLAENEIEIHVACTGMNFKDVVIAMGQLASPYIGVECSGTVARVGPKVTSLSIGDRVCAVPMGAYGTIARCLATSAAVIPHDMSFEVAASIPVVYCTAYYGLINQARLEEGERILIHAASGGVGQAAIQLAQMVGAEIYATVGSTEKKEFIMEKYGIPASRIFYSRDSSFGPAVRHATGGKGVDVVINSLAGDLLRESWASLAPFGRFVEIGKRDITSNSRLDMLKFDSNCTFSSVDLTLVAAERPRLMSRVMSSVMALLRRKIIHPIGPITVAGFDEVESSLRKLQSGKTSGKMIIDHSKPAKVKATHPGLSSGALSRDASYLIIGGTGGIGCAISRRLVELGACHVVLLSRSGEATAEVERLTQESKAHGATIYVERCDVGNLAAVSELVSKVSQSLPPVRGIVHAAMVLRDMLFEKMRFDDYNAVVESKISGAINFHNAYRGQNLDFFIMLSSVAGIVGNRGQAAYSGANTFLDALAAHRRQIGLAATSLNLTAVDDVGYLAANGERKSEVLKNISGSTMSQAEVLALVEAAIKGQVSESQCITGLDLDEPASLPFWTADGKFRHIRDKALASSADLGAGSSSDMSIADRLKQLTGADEAVELVASELGGKLAAILMLAPEDMEAQKSHVSITAFGLDSLNAIELRNWIGKELQAHLQVLELLTSGRLTDLAALALKKSRLIGPWSKVES